MSKVDFEEHAKSLPKGKPSHIGLRGLTDEEIEYGIQEYLKNGHKVEHLKTFDSGVAMPYNGILRVNMGV